MAPGGPAAVPVAVGRRLVSDANERKAAVVRNVRVLVKGPTRSAVLRQRRRGERDRQSNREKNAPATHTPIVPRSPLRCRRSRRPSVSPHGDKCAAVGRLKVSQKAPKIREKIEVILPPLGISWQFVINRGVALMNRRSFFGMLAGGAVAFPIAPLWTSAQRLNRSGTALSAAHAKISMVD